jgi:hypothetical protein
MSITTLGLPLLQHLHYLIVRAGLDPRTLEALKAADMRAGGGPQWWQDLPYGLVILTLVLTALLSLLSLWLTKHSGDSK